MGRKSRGQCTMLVLLLFTSLLVRAQQQPSHGSASTANDISCTYAAHRMPEAIAGSSVGSSRIAAAPPFVGESVLSARDFPFLTALLGNPALRKSLASDPELKKIVRSRWTAAAEANLNCKNDVVCKSAALLFTPAQIDEVSLSLSRLYRQNSAVRYFVQHALKPREIYTLNPSDSEEQLFLGSWKRSAEAMNRIIATYCNGVPPRYSAIDSMSYQPGSHAFQELVGIILDDLPLEESGRVFNAGASSPGQSQLSEVLFFEPALRFSLRLLEANGRDEAGRFWPLASGENENAVRRISGIQWAKYRYSVLLIPGEGPSTYNIPLSAWGKERLRLGVAAYRAGLAPFFLLSGGFVHPSQTSFSEAIEMKKYLEQVYGIPASVIFVDPYARHTTTNLRNAAREIFDYGLPTDRPMLIVSDPFQTDYIASDGFHKRNLKELGYMPVILGKRLSPSRLEAIPVRQSEFRDPLDPLDP